MKTSKIMIVLLVTILMLTAQVGTALAAPSLLEEAITGTVTAVTCEIDSTTSLPTFFVTLDVAGVSQTVHIDQATAISSGAITPEAVCNSDGTVTGANIGATVSIDPGQVIPEVEEPQHPVGAALAFFFSDVADYEAIMTAHEDGTGFGLIAQALWLTRKMEGDAVTFAQIVQAKKDGDFSAFVLPDGSTPQNWGQFKKAVLSGDKKANLGVVMSDKDNNGQGQDKEKSNNGKKGNNGKNKND